MGGHSAQDEGLLCPETSLWLIVHELGLGKGEQIKATGKLRNNTLCIQFIGHVAVNIIS